jgi:antitoxin ParD1/3/4
VILLEERERKLAALDATLARGLVDCEAGRVYSAAEVLDRLGAKYSAMTDKQAS